MRGPMWLIYRGALMAIARTIAQRLVRSPSLARTPPTSPLPLPFLLPLPITVHHKKN